MYSIAIRQEAGLGQELKTWINGREVEPWQANAMRMALRDLSSEIQVAENKFDRVAQNLLVSWGFPTEER